MIPPFSSGDAEHQARPFFSNFTTNTIRSFADRVNDTDPIDYGRIIRTPTEAHDDRIIASNGTFIANISEFIWGTEIMANVAPNGHAPGQPPLLGDGDGEELVVEYIYDRTDVRIIFITLYSLVFACCFFGEWNRFVIYLMKLPPKCN